MTCIVLSYSAISDTRFCEGKGRTNKATMVAMRAVRSRTVQ